MATRRVKSFDEFKEELESNPTLQAQFKTDPVSAIADFQQQNPLTNDKWIYRIIVLALGFTILAIILGVIVLIAMGKISDDKGVPTILTAIGSAAIGALAGLLAPPPKSN
jgi:hypothetical protein